MRKVGIITRHYRINYGSRLQAVALQRAIESMGFYCEIIDYRYDGALTGWALFCSKLGKRFYYITHIDIFCGKMIDKIATLVNRKNIKRKTELYKRFFTKYMKVTSKVYMSDEEILADPPIFDIYIVGSDQTWNPFVCDNPDAFYLSFAPEGAKKASYAPSIAIDEFSPEQAARFLRLTRDIQYLSCREEEGSELIRRITGREVTTVLDPTFLLSKEEWEKFSEEMPHPKRYILQYLLGEKKEHRKYVKKLAEKFNLPVVSIPRIPRDMIEGGVIRRWPGPSGFLRLLMDAELVCTDSFHGTALSINFEVPVYTFLKMDANDPANENSRIRSLYDRFGIKNRIITDFSILPRNYAFCYRDYKEKYDALVNNSYKYLRTILDES